MSKTSNQLKTIYFKALTGERTIEVRAARSPSEPQMAKTTPIPLNGVTQLGTEAQRMTKRPATYDHRLQRARRSRRS